MATTDRSCDKSPGTTAWCPYRLTCWVGTLFGLVLVLVWPPFRSPDEGAHFLRAYECSEGKVYSRKLGEATGDDVPVSLWKIYLEATNGGDGGSKIFSWPKVRDAFSIPLAPDQREDRHFGNTARFSPLCYLPQAVGIAVGRAVGLPALPVYYTGRLVNLIVYLALAIAAVRWMPVQRWTMALIIMMPLSMFLCATVSADVPTNGVSLLAIAMVLHYAIRAEKVTARDLAGLVAVFCALALVKQGYVLLTLLFFMIPSAKLGGRKRYALAALAVVGLPMLVELAWSLSVKPLYVPLREHVDLAGQIQFILRQPWKYCKMVIRSVVFFGGDVEGTRIYWDLIGVLGWQDVRLPWFVQSLYWTALAGTAIGDSQGAGNVTLRVRTGAVVVFGLGSVLLATSAFLSWTPKGLLAIMGLQARYWIPFAPLMLLPFVGLAAKYVDRMAKFLVPVLATLAVCLGIGGTIYSMITTVYLP